MDNFQGIDPKYLALIQAGMGILAANNGRQPAGAAIGQGLLGGTNAYQQNLLQQQEAAMRKQEMDMRGQEFDWKKKEFEQKTQQKSNEEKMNEQILKSLGIGVLPTEPQESSQVNYNILQPTELPQPPQSQGMSRDQLYKLGVALSLTGGHGGDALLKYADMNKPNWLNLGGKFVDANQYQGEIPVSPAPMSEADKARGAWEGWLPPQNQPTQQPPISHTPPKQSPVATNNPSPAANNQPSGYVYNPNLSPKANQDLAVKDANAAIEAKYKPAPISAGQEAIDREFGKEYATYIGGGGYSDTLKQLSQLKVASDALGVEGNNLTGKLYGMTPESIRPYTNPEAVNNQELVQEAAQRNLRIVLGAQFTEKEGDRLIARVYNPKLPPATNKLRVDRLAEQIKLAAKSKDDAMKYFEKNGTLKGWAGKLYTMADFEKAVEGKEGAGAITPKEEKAPKDISKLPKSKIVKMNGKSVSLLLDADGDYYNPATGKKVSPR